MWIHSAGGAVDGYFYVQPLAAASFRRCTCFEHQSRGLCLPSPMTLPCRLLREMYQKISTPLSATHVGLLAERVFFMRRYTPFALAVPAPLT